MTIPTIILSVLLLCGICAAQSTVELQLEDTEYELEDLVSSGTALAQTESRSEVPQEEDTEEAECTEITIGAYLSFAEGRVLRTFTTVNISLCCEECQSMEDCTTFRRNRTSGSCELFIAEDPYFELNSASDFDIGGFIGDEFSPLFFIAPSSIQVPSCIINRGRIYPNGNVLVRGSSRTARRCCDVCRSSSDCNSWYYNIRSDRCTLNRNIPTSVSADSSRFSGGSV